MRWYFCPPDAPLFPFPHGAESSVWLKSHEKNLAWGEPHRWKTRDWGENPGYVAGCFVGQPWWFADGHLPADVLDGDAPPFSPCCFVSPSMPFTLYQTDPGVGDPPPFEIDDAVGARFDRASGLELIDNGDSTGTITLMPATATHAGGVTTGGQQWAGLKTFVDTATPGNLGTLAMDYAGLTLSGCQTGDPGFNQLSFSLLMEGGSSAWGNVVGESLEDASAYYGSGGSVVLNDNCMELRAQGVGSVTFGLVLRTGPGLFGSGYSNYCDFVSYEGLRPAFRIIDAFERVIYTGETGDLPGGGVVTGGLVTTLPAIGLTGTFP